MDYLVTWAQGLGLDAEVDGAGNAVITVGERERKLRVASASAPSCCLATSTRCPGSSTCGVRAPSSSGAVPWTRRARWPRLRSLRRGQLSRRGRASSWSVLSRRRPRRPRGPGTLLSRLSPDAVVIGEPSGWDRLTVGYKGRLLVDYALERAIGHTAGPDAGACDEAFVFWDEVQALAATHNQEHPRMFDQVSPSLRRMQSHSNGFVETAELTFGFRLPPELDIDRFISQLSARAGDARLSFRGRESAYHAPKNTPLARAFIKAVDAEGGRAQFKVKSGTSDMNVVGPVWACPILAYGPGDSRLDHTPNEHIDLDEYHRAIAVLTRVLQNV